MSVLTNPHRKYIREHGLPHFFCPGCGCGQVLNYFIRGCDELGLDPADMVCIGGVGCAARIPVYLNTDTLHGIHGRTLPWASGIKLTKPEIPVVVFSGDGDAGSIGGNHFIHAARRNLDVTLILVNNLNFAMTGGQVAPTTPLKSITMTTPYGSSEPPFDLCELAITSGATYVSRWTTGHSIQAIKAIKTALTHKGFSMVEIITQCPTHFGRYALGTGQADKMVDWIKGESMTKAQSAKMDEEEAGKKMLLGEMINIEKPVFKGSTIYEVG